MSRFILPYSAKRSQSRAISKLRNFCKGLSEFLLIMSLADCRYAIDFSLTDAVSTKYSFSSLTLENGLSSIEALTQLIDHVVDFGNRFLARLGNGCRYVENIFAPLIGEIVHMHKRLSGFRQGDRTVRSRQKAWSQERRRESTRLRQAPESTACLSNADSV